MGGNFLNTDLTDEQIKNAQDEIGDQLKDFQKESREIEEKIKKEEETILNFLHNPKLLDLIVCEIQNKKVVGEKETIEAIFIITNCRKVKNIKPTSSNLLVNDESGLGKDFITKAVLDIYPKKDIVYRTKITPELLTYWHNPKFEPDWTWEGKVFYLEDASNKIINSDVFKVFSSGGSKATVLIKQTPVDIEVKGKPSMIVTSAEVNPKNENLRRYPICFLDDSDEQTLNIMIRQSEEDETGDTLDYNPIITRALDKLERVKVVIPFAKKLPEFFPKNRFMRTHYKRFLDIIKSVTCLYQYQRKKDENGNVISEGNDYEVARRILLKTASNPSMIPLTKQMKDFLDYFKKNIGDWYSIPDIDNQFVVSDRTLQKWVKKLYKYGFLKTKQEKREGVKRPVPTYSFNEINQIEIPNWDSVNSFNSFNSVISVNSVNNTLGEQQIENKSNKTNKTNKNLTKEKSLHDQILDLKEFILNEKNANRKIWYESLKSKFDENFISHCLQSGILIKLPNDEYILEVFN